MNELKSYTALVKGNNDLGAYIESYRKCDVDTYIQELEEQHKKEVEQLLILNREQNNRHLRYEDSMQNVIRRIKKALWVSRAQTAEAYSHLFDKLWCTNPHDKVGVTGCLHKLSNHKRMEYPSTFFNLWYDIKLKCTTMADKLRKPK